jgi:hypothetical protein
MSSAPMMLEAVLDRWSLIDGTFQARFTQGPTETPVIYVTVQGLENSEAVESYFRGIEPFNDGVTVELKGPNEVGIHHEYSQCALLRGENITVRTSDLELADYQRTARVNEEWGQSQYDRWQKLNLAVSDAKHLLEDQRRRLAEKAERHAPDSTARLLYIQQLSFIDRVLAKLDI